MAINIVIGDGSAPNKVECHFCGDTKDSVDAAIEAGWIPSFYDGNPDGEECEVTDPVCVACQDEYLRYDEATDAWIEKKEEKPE